MLMFMLIRLVIANPNRKSIPLMQPLSVQTPGRRMMLMHKQCELP